jgi:hypothetical protein
MFYVAIDQKIYDDGHGMNTAPGYGLNEFNERYELDQAEAEALTKRYEDALSLRVARSRFPIGDAVARMTQAVGIQPCPPCKRRQAALNQFGDRVADWWRR